jgi:peroxiredoxin
MLRSALIQILFFTVIFNGISFFRELSLLPTDSEQAAPGFNLAQLSGGVMDKNDLKGKNTVVYFFAPWCHVCHASMGNLESLYQDKQGEINVVAIALSYDSASEIAEFIDDKALSFPVLLGNDTVMNRYQINAFPSYYVFNQQGVITAKSQGYSTELGLRLRAL